MEGQRELAYLKEMGLKADRYIVIPPQVAKHAVGIPGAASCCMPLEEEDSMKFFDEVGWHLITKKWAEAGNNGILEMYDNFMKVGQAVTEPINSVPFKTPEQAFDAPDNTIPPVDKKEVPKPPTEEKKEVPKPPMAVVKEEYIEMDLKGNPRDPNTSDLISKLVGATSKKEFLYARKYESNGADRLVGPNGEFFILAELEAFSAGQFYEAYVFKTNKAKEAAAQAEVNKPKEIQGTVDERKAQLEALGFEMNKMTYSFVRGTDKISHSSLQIMSNIIWDGLIASFNKVDEEEKLMIERYEERKKRLGAFNFVHDETTDIWNDDLLKMVIHNGDVVTLSDKDFEGIMEAAEFKANELANAEKQSEAEAKAKIQELLMAEQEAKRQLEEQNIFAKKNAQIAEAARNEAALLLEEDEQEDEPEVEALAAKMDKNMKANIALAKTVKIDDKVFTNFFSKILGYRFKSIQLGINRVDDKQVGNPEENVTVTLNVTPFKEDEAFSSLPSLVFKAKVDEFDNTFFSEIEKPLGAAEKMFSNSDTFLKELAKAEAKTKKAKALKDDLEKAQKALKEYLAGDKQTDVTLRKRIEAVLDLDPNDKVALAESNKMQQQSLL